MELKGDKKLQNILYLFILFFIFLHSAKLLNIQTHRPKPEI